MQSKRHLKQMFLTRCLKCLLMDGQKSKSAPLCVPLMIICFVQDFFFSFFSGGGGGGGGVKETYS